MVCLGKQSYSKVRGRGWCAWANRATARYPTLMALINLSTCAAQVQNVARIVSKDFSCAPNKKPVVVCAVCTFVVNTLTNTDAANRPLAASTK